AEEAGRFLVRSDAEEPGKQAAAADAAAAESRAAAEKLAADRAARRTAHDQRDGCREGADRGMLERPRRCARCRKPDAGIPHTNAARRHRCWHATPQPGAS